MFNVNINAAPLGSGYLLVKGLNKEITARCFAEHACVTEITNRQQSIE